MSEPKRIQRKRTKGWRMPEGAVYVGRPSKWGNPFGVKQATGWPRWAGSPPWLIVTPDGAEWDYEHNRRPIIGRAEANAVQHLEAARGAVELFRLHIGPMGNYEYDNETLALLRTELAGRDLACWCPLNQSCHADVLLELANRPAPATSPGGECDDESRSEA